MATYPDFDLSQFLLPSNHVNPADRTHGIPQPLAFRRGLVPSSISTSPLHYALSRHRLPFRVIHDARITSRMIAALRSILSQSTPVKLDDVSDAWVGVRVTEKTSLTSGTEAEITQFSARLLEVVSLCFNSLKAPRIVEHIPQHTGNNDQVKIDHVLLWREMVEPLVLIEDKSISVMSWHLDELLSVPEDLFRRTTQWNWEGTYSIIAKLSWKATLFPSRYCKWAVVYSGDQFVIYHILRISEPNETNPTVVMTYSDVIAIDDTETPYIALLVYMLLSTGESHSSLATTLHVNPPQGTNIVDELESEWEEKSRRRSEDQVVNIVRVPADCAIAPSLSKASEVTVTFMPNTSGKVVYKRIPVSIPALHTPATPDPRFNLTPGPECPPSTDSPILTLSPLGYGAIGVVYQAAEGCVVKFSRSPKTAGDLVNEAVIYTILKASSVACFIPRLFGLFRNGEMTALILSNEGTPVIRFEELSLRDRKQVYTVLAHMHTCGVLHGDFRPANVLRGPRGPILIDFSHSKSDHVCPLDEPCGELRNAQTQLRLTDADLERIRTWMAFELWRFLYRLATCLLVRAAGVTAALVAVAALYSVGSSAYSA